MVMEILGFIAGSIIIVFFLVVMLGAVLAGL